jgi:hypothetical protein
VKRRKEKKEMVDLQAIYRMLKEAADLDTVEVDGYFAITEKDGEYVLRLKSGAWLEHSTFQAILDYAKKTGGSYTAMPHKVFTIPIKHTETVAAADEPTREEPKESDMPYSLAASREGLGELSPVLKDAHGNIIDGFHRVGESAAWHSITVPHIDDPVKLELARLAVNFARRTVSSAELTQRITFLRKAGLSPDEISKKTGISKATIYRHTPQELKSEKAAKISETRKTISEVSRYDVSRDTSYLTPQDTEEHNRLIDALDVANYPNCPICLDVAVKINQALPWVKCARGHSWNLKTGSHNKKGLACDISASHLEQCSRCHVSVSKDRLENGVCDICRQKDKRTKDALDAELSAALGQPPAPAKDPEEYEPTRVEAKTAAPTKPVDYDSQDITCPFCGGGCSPGKWERMKQRFGGKYPELFQEEGLGE